MAWTTVAAVYFVIWWIVLFTVLPFGVRSQHEHGERALGTDPGAPTMALIGRKLIWTTVIAGIVFALFALVYTSRIVSLDDLATLWGLIK